MVKVRVSLGSQRSSHWLVGLTSIAAVVMAVQACSSEPEVDRGKSGEAGDANGSGGGNTGGRSGLAFGGVGASTSNGGTNSLTSCESETDCPEGITCKYDVCLPNLGSCESYDDCPGDSYCDPAGLCVPYGVPEDVVNDPSCQRGEAPDGVEPDEQCSWDGSDDANPEFHDIYTTPLVADLNLDDDPQKLQPSIIFTGFNRGEERVGILRVVGGRDCKEQLQLGSADNPNDPDRPAYGAQLAIGDLNGDVGSGGHPEIVGLHRTPGALGSYPPVRPIAWEIVDQTGGKALKTKWKGRVCGGVNDGTAVQFGNAWLEFGPGLWDLDNDGVPEVVYDKFVFDSQGCVLNESIRTAADVQAAVDSLYSPYLYSGSNPSTSSNDKGAISTVADVDGDGDPELVRFDGIYEWKGGN